MTIDMLRDAVQARMLELGMTQDQYAKHIGVGRPHLNMFLNGKITPGDKLLEALKVTATTIYAIPESLS